MWNALQQQPSHTIQNTLHAERSLRLIHVDTFYAGFQHLLAYLAAGAIVTMTKALAKDLISKKGIRVNAVAPGPIWTPIPVESFTEEMVRTTSILF